MLHPDLIAVPRASDEDVIAGDAKVLQRKHAGEKVKIIAEHKQGSRFWRRAVEARARSFVIRPFDVYTDAMLLYPRNKLVSLVDDGDSHALQILQETSPLVGHDYKVVVPVQHLPSFPTDSVVDAEEGCMKFVLWAWVRHYVSFDTSWANRAAAIVSLFDDDLACAVWLLPDMLSSEKIAVGFVAKLAGKREVHVECGALWSVAQSAQISRVLHVLHVSVSMLSF